MKSYDKASWHIDGGEERTEVIVRFKAVFDFLYKKGMLTEDGAETMEYGMDDSVSLNSTMVTMDGEAFMEKFYDSILDSNIDVMKENLESSYRKFISKN